MFESNAVFVTMLICGPAAVLAARQSTWLVDYLFFVVALNRGIRRFVDYENGYFNSFSLISLTPIIVGGFAVVVVLMRLNRGGGQFGGRTRKVLTLYGGAVAFAFLIGFINAKFGAVYALGDYIAPIGLIGYGSQWSSKPKIISRWCHTFAASVLVVAVYGLWQFYTIPPWDAFWLIEAKMDGYMGIPEPTKMTLFSTMAERGPAAMYLCSGLMLLTLRPGTLGLLRWPTAVIVLYAMLLTYSRTTVIFSGLAVLLYPLLNRGTGWLPVAALTIAMTVAGPSLLGQLPGQASARVGTIGVIQDDGSFQGRLMLFGIAMRNSMTQPLGLGIGAGGLASRVQQANVSAVADSTGYADTLATYGWIGFFVIINVLYKLWRSSTLLIRRKIDDRNVRIFRAWFIAGMAALFSGNWLAGASFFWVLAGHTLGRYDADQRQRRENWERSREDAGPAEESSIGADENRSERVVGEPVANAQQPMVGPQ